MENNTRLSKATQAPTAQQRLAVAAHEYRSALSLIGYPVSDLKAAQAKGKKAQPLNTFSIGSFNPLDTVAGFVGKAETVYWIVSSQLGTYTCTSPDGTLNFGVGEPWKTKGRRAAETKLIEVETEWNAMTDRENCSWDGEYMYGEWA